MKINKTMIWCLELYIYPHIYLVIERYLIRITKKNVIVSGFCHREKNNKKNKTLKNIAFLPYIYLKQKKKNLIDAHNFTFKYEVIEEQGTD